MLIHFIIIRQIFQGQQFNNMNKHSLRQSQKIRQSEGEYLAKTVLQEESELQQDQLYLNTHFHSETKDTNKNYQQISTWNNQQNGQKIGEKNIAQNYKVREEKLSQFNSRNRVRGNVNMRKMHRFTRQFTEFIDQKHSQSYLSQPKCSINILNPKIIVQQQIIKRKIKNKPYSHLGSFIINHIELHKDKRKRESEEKIKCNKKIELQTVKFQSLKLGEKKDKEYCLLQNQSIYKKMKSKQHHRSERFMSEMLIRISNHQDIKNEKKVKQKSESLAKYEALSKKVQAKKQRKMFEGLVTQCKQNESLKYVEEFRRIKNLLALEKS